MEPTYDVIIAGAGPVGLLLAGELALQKVSVVVLERDASPESPWKTLPLGRRGLNTVAFEALYRRGMLGQFVDLAAGGLGGLAGKSPAGEAPPPRFGGHFAGLLIDPAKIERARWRYRLDGPALYPAPTTLALLEATLATRAEDLGVTILRGVGFSGVTEDARGVTVATADQSLRGRWLVGCDGGRSAVRHAAGIAFVGSDPTFTGYGAHCEVDHPERLQPGFHPTDNGMYIVSPGTLYVMDFDGGAFDRSTPVTQELLQDRFAAISGRTDVHITKVHLGTVFTDRAKQAATYRKGRILLAGDAAHIHAPLGAQGLNLGLGDALNLGWKLAATIRREVADKDADWTLLDSYDAERRPLGAAVLDWTRAQAAVLQPTPGAQALHRLVAALIGTPDGANYFMDHIMGLSQRYALGGEHPLVGCSAPDFDFGAARLGPQLATGRGLLIDFRDDARLKDTLSKYDARVDYLATKATDPCGLRALLVRPDGVVAWATDTHDECDMEALAAALERWFAF